MEPTRAGWPPPREARPEKRDRAELWAAILLGLAAFATAFSAFRAGLRDGEAIAGYAESNRALSDANYYFNLDDTQINRDSQLVTELQLAINEGNTVRAEFLESTVMSDDLVEALEWFETTDEVESVFEFHGDNPYRRPWFEQAKKDQSRSDKRFVEGQTADEQGDRYELAAVLFAMTLFFAGIATLLRGRRPTLILLVVGGLGLIGGAAVLVSV